MNQAQFDRHAETYERELQDALAVTGLDKDYFARGRVQWLANCLRELGEEPASVLDYGCGTGAATLLLEEIIGAASVVGVDVSEHSIALAQRRYGSDVRQFYAFSEYSPCASVELAFCNGVFHHIPPAERSSALAYVRAALRPGGTFAFWENNPWNPGARYVMSRCAFDADAITITSIQARRMLRAAGFQVIRTDFLFVFPRPLAWLLFLEPALASLPLGGQYQILCRKPGDQECQ